MVVTTSDPRRVRKRAARKGGWTKARRAKFLSVLAETCNVRAAARAAGMGYRDVYRVRDRDPEFAALWADALASGYDRLETTLMARAMGSVGDDDGVREDNPDADEIAAAGADGEEAAGPFDADLALKLLAHRNAALRAGGARRGPLLQRVTLDAMEASLLRKLDAMAKAIARRAGGGA